MTDHDAEILERDGRRFLVIEIPESQPIDINIKTPLHLLIDTVYKVMKESECFYRSGRTILYVDKEKGGIEFLGRTDLIIELSRFIRWKIETDRRDEVVDLPARIEKYLVDTNAVYTLNEVKGLARHDLIDDFGRLGGVFCKYDIKRKILFDYERDEFGEFHWQTVSKAEVLDSIDFLLNIFEDFPLRNKLDEAKLLCSLLTAVFRSILPAAPLMMISANHSGSGKSLLCDSLGIVASGEKPVTMSMPSSEDECARALIAVLRKSPLAVLYDNAVGAIQDFNALCTCLTQSTYTNRIVGTSQTVSVNTSALFLMSGNNVEPMGDLSRRVIKIMLYSQNNARKRYKFPDFVDYIKKNRAKIVISVQKIAAGYLQKKSKLETSSVASYSEWSRYCREPLIDIGYPDPAVDILNALVEEDPAEILRLEIVEELHRIFRDREFGVREIVLETTKDRMLKQLLPSYLLDDFGRLNRTALGSFVRSLYQSPPSGFVLVRKCTKPSSRYCINRIEKM